MLYIYIMFVVVSSYNLNTKMKQPKESIADYTVELHKMIEHRSYSDILKDMLRDHIICGINDLQL